MTVICARWSFRATVRSWWPLILGSRFDGDLRSAHRAAPVQDRPLDQTPGQHDHHAAKASSTGQLTARPTAAPPRPWNRRHPSGLEQSVIPRSRLRFPNGARTGPGRGRPAGLPGPVSRGRAGVTECGSRRHACRCSRRANVRPLRRRLAGHVTSIFETLNLGQGGPLPRGVRKRRARVCITFKIRSDAVCSDAAKDASL